MSESAGSTPSASAELVAVADTIIAGRQSQFRELIGVVAGKPSPTGLRWAEIDLYEAFDPETSNCEKANPWRNWSVYVLFVPLLLTWVGLSVAVKDYNELPAAERRVRSFFEVWVDGGQSTFLGVNLSLFNIAIAVAMVFVAAIALGIMSDRHANTVNEQRDALRSALTTASLSLTSKYPRSAEGATVTLEAFALDLQDASAKASAVLERIAEHSARLTQELAENARSSARLIDQASRQAIDKHSLVVNDMNQALGFATDALIRASMAAQALTASTELDRHRREEQDRVISHLSDILADIKLLAPDSRATDDYEPSP